MESTVNFDLGEMLENPLIDIDFLNNDDDILLKSLQSFKTSNTNSRFANVNEEKLQSYEEATQSKSTKNNTKWALKIVQNSF